MSHSRSKAAVKSGGTAVDTSVSVVRQLQGEDTVAVQVEWWKDVRGSLGLPPLIG